MKKIAYLSLDCFFDVDFPILKKINERYDLLWLPIINKDNHRFNESDIADYCNINNINYLLMQPSGRRISLSHLKMAFDIIRTIRKYNPDIIYLEYLSDIYTYYLIKLFLPKSKIIIAIHDVVHHSNFGSFLNRFLSNQKIKDFNKFHLFSLSQKKIFDCKYSGLSYYAPLSLKDFGTPTITQPIKETQTNLLFFGSILSYKGLDLLIEACEKLHKKRPDLKFTLNIAGKGDDWTRCKKLIKSEKIYNYKIRFIDNQEIPNLFRENHFLVLPYRDVTQSGPLMISYNYEIPVIASDEDGFIEFIDNNINGFLFESKNQNSLYHVLEKAVCLEKSDYDLLIRNLRIKKNKFNIDEIINNYEIMFESI